jgi:TonB family protein
MNAALIYRQNNRWLVCLAFSCAILIHVGAIALAKKQSDPMPGPDTFETEIEGTDVPPAPPQEDEAVAPLEQSINSEEQFVEENVTSRATHVRRKIPIVPVAHSIGFGGSMPTHTGPAKALALYAPKPDYPYEARRGGVTGSGIAELTVDVQSGSVRAARMQQSTGSAILDRATVGALERWRFKPGVASNVTVPITYTLTGVSY